MELVTVRDILHAMELSVLIVFLFSAALGRAEYRLAREDCHRPAPDLDERQQRNRRHYYPADVVSLCVSRFGASLRVLIFWADKEVEGFYDDGMRVDDDITLLWTDDKYGHRHLID